MRKFMIPLFAFATAAFAAKIELPQNWPYDDKMALGFAWANSTDNSAINDGVDADDEYFLYRYMNKDNGSSAISEMTLSFDDLDGTENASVILSLFLTEDILNADAKDIKDEILKKMDDKDLMEDYFRSLKSLSEPVNEAKGNPVIVFEPNTFGYLLQAKFHFEKEEHKNGKKYADILEFPAEVSSLYSKLKDVDEFAFLKDEDEYPNTVAGLARAIIRAAKELMPKAVIVGHASTWAVYSDGCSGGGAVASDDVVNGKIDVQGKNSVVTWEKSDIDLGAFAAVRFYRELYGWDDTKKVRKNVENWPDAMAVERGGVDAGLVLEGGSNYASSKVGSGTDVFFWDQGKMDKWLLWSKDLSHGIQLPLIALKIPVGNGSLKNTPFHYQDTFSDWLYSTDNWENGGADSDNDRPMTFSSGNWDRFKAAGFIGLWVGRDGWPAVGTHYGARKDAGGTGSTFSGTIKGDEGDFIKLFKENTKTTSFETIETDFNEETFETYTGFCSINATVATTDWIGASIDTISTNVFVGEKQNKTGETLVTNSDALTKNPALLALKENNLLIYSVDVSGSTSLINAPSKPPTSGSATTANSGLTPGQTSLLSEIGEFGLSLDMSIPGLGDLADGSASTSDLVKASWPLNYVFNLYSADGQFISNAEGTIGEEDLLKIGSACAESPSDFCIKLFIRILPISEEGKHISSGVYILRGFFREEVKNMCEQSTTKEGDEPIKFSLAERINKSDCLKKNTTTSGVNMLKDDGTVKTFLNGKVKYSTVKWGLRPRNAISINSKLGYLRK